MISFIVMVYVLAVLISLCLISGQSLWGSAVKQIAPPGSNVAMQDLLIQMLQHPKLWLGGLCYVAGTVLYFMLLSQAKFFSVQISMTGLAIVLSVLISYFVFREVITSINIVGILLVLLGVALVMHR